MDVPLLAITVASLLAALVFGAVAWRLGRHERTRSAARVAALAAASARAPEAPAGTVAATPDWPPVVAIRAAVAEPVAVNESRPWAPARVSAFAARPAAIDDLPLTPEPFRDAFLGSSLAQPASAGRQRGLAIAATFLFVAVVVGGYWTLFGNKSTAVSAVAADTSAQAPLELVSLRHERRGPRLAVTGLVRNPGAGAPVEKLAAVVFLFDQQGAFLSSARANLDSVTLAPGDESPFVIAVEAPAEVARYRVSFRNDAGVVPHIDRRGQVVATGELR